MAIPSIDDQLNQVSNFKLKVSYWYVTHKLQLKTGLVVFLIVLSVVFFSYSLYQAIMILIVQNQEWQETRNFLTADLIDYQYFHQKNRPTNLQLLGFEVIKATEGNYDFVVKLNNSNEKWIVDNAVIQLVSGDQIIEEKNTFVYPGQTKYVVFFNQEEVSPTASQIRITQVEWKRYLKFVDFADPRLNFEISEVEFESVTESGLRGKLPVSNLSFKIKNATAYSYWRVGIQMILLTTQKVGGANYLALDQFKSGEERKVEMRWYEPLPPIYEVEVIPEVDILDPDSYMPVE